MRLRRKRVLSRPSSELAEGHDVPSARPTAWSARWGDQLARRLAALNPREQTLLAVAAGLVLFGLLVSVAVQPAWRSLQQGPAQQQALRMQTLQVAELEQQTKALRARPRWGTAEAASRLQANSAALGDALQLNITGQQASVTLKSVPAQALATWLSGAREQAHAVTIEARLTRDAPGPEGTDRWSGALVLRLPP